MVSGKSAPCSHETLAVGSAARVDRCRTCGTLSLHIGATTVRFELEAAQSLWTTLGDALLKLDALDSGDGGLPLSQSFTKGAVPRGSA